MDQMELKRRQQMKLGGGLDGKDYMLQFITESLGLKCVDGVIDFSDNPELMETLYGNRYAVVNGQYVETTKYEPDPSNRKSVLEQLNRFQSYS